MTGALTNHLWQSTLFALAIALAALVFRKNRAQVRYALWLSASLKFLLPFSLIFMLGTHLTPPSWKAAKHVAAPVVSQAVGQIAQPFPGFGFFALSAPSTSRFAAAFPAILFVTWLCGFAIIALLRFRGWLRIRAAVRSSTLLNISAGVEVRSCPGLLEPGVVGLGLAGLSKPSGSPRPGIAACHRRSSGAATRGPIAGDDASRRLENVFRHGFSEAEPDQRPPNPQRP